MQAVLRVDQQQTRRPVALVTLLTRLEQLVVMDCRRRDTVLQGLYDISGLERMFNGSRRGWIMMTYALSHTLNMKWGEGVNF